MPDPGVATRIVEQLHVRLSPDEAGSLQRWGTRNAAAYDEYLRGHALVERYQRRENIQAARLHFERALEIDLAFAPAMATPGRGGVARSASSE